MYKQLIPVLACLALLTTACSLGSGRVVTEAREVSGFDEVVFSGIGDLTITQGAVESLTIEAESNIIRRITSEVRGGVLHIGLSSGWFGTNPVPTKAIRYTLAMKDLHSLDLAGLGSIYAGGIDSDRLSVDLSGGGKVVIRSLKADEVTVSLSGLGSCELTGQTTLQDVSITGGGNYDAADLESQEVSIVSTGLGKATLWATGTLSIKLSGAGSIEYYGEARVRQDVTGLGRVRSLGSR